MRLTLLSGSSSIFVAWIFTGPPQMCCNERQVQEHVPNSLTSNISSTCYGVCCELFSMNTFGRLRQLLLQLIRTSQRWRWGCRGFLRSQTLRHSRRGCSLHRCTSQNRGAPLLYMYWLLPSSTSTIRNIHSCRKYKAQLPWE